MVHKLTCFPNDIISFIDKIKCFGLNWKEVFNATFYQDEAAKIYITKNSNKTHLVLITKCFREPDRNQRRLLVRCSKHGATKTEMESEGYNNVLGPMMWHMHCL